MEKGKELMKQQLEQMREKYALKAKLEEQVHKNIIAEIKAASKLGVEKRMRNSDQ